MIWAVGVPSLRYSGYAHLASRHVLSSVSVRVKFSQYSAPLALPPRSRSSGAGWNCLKRRTAMSHEMWWMYRYRSWHPQTWPSLQDSQGIWVHWVHHSLTRLYKLLLLKLGTSGSDWIDRRKTVWIRTFSAGYQVWAWPQTACHELRSGRSLLWEVGAVCWTTHTCQTCHRYCQHLRVWTKRPKGDQGCLVQILSN